jgi:adenylate cyclase
MSVRTTGPLPPAAAAEAPSPAAVRAQLERILASPEFTVPERLQRFLQYIVNEALAGRADRIKAYTIGVEVFGRDESFDPQADTVVRIEAGRLRRRLEHYYLSAGQEDLVRIEIPKGAYVPLFAQHAAGPTDASARISVDDPAADSSSVDRWRGWLRTAVVPSALMVLTILGLFYWMLSSSSEFGPGRVSAVPKVALPQGPVLLVTPFADLGGAPEVGLYAIGLTEEVLTQLAAFKELSVLGRETSRSIAAGSDRARRLRQLGVDYVIEGGVRVDGGRMRVTARLLNGGTSTVLWSQAYDEDLQVRSLFAIQQSVANAVATVVAQPYGIVFRADERRDSSLTAPDDVEAYGCTLRFYTYRLEYGPEQHATVRACLEQAVERFPDYSTAWAMLSFLYLDEDRFGFNPKSGDLAPLDRALEAAHRAVALDPDNVRALQALMTTLFFRQELKESLRVGERALALNPNDTELLAEFGTRLAESGEWARGSALVEQALARNPGHSGYYYGILALCDWVTGRPVVGHGIIPVPGVTVAGGGTGESIGIAG